MKTTPSGKPGGLRRKSRQAALALLYQSDMGVPDFSAHLEHYFAQNRLPPKAKDYAEQLVLGVMEHLQTLDEAITKVSAHWRLDRMNVIDRNILRLAAFEILYKSDIPRKVSINEAIEIAKAFGTEDSGSFINGILDRFQKPDEEPKDSPGEKPENEG